MKIALTHRSALEALSLLASRGDIGAFPRTSLPSGFRSSADTAEIECLQRAYGLQEPIQALSCEAASRRERGRLERRRFNPTCMTQGFVELEPGVFASSPELCFIQLCDELDVVDAVRLLGWMAGTYSLDCDGNLAHIEREPLLCKESLANAFEQFKGVHGISSAKRAARYAPFRCASPKESEVGALLQLPGELGGCGFPAAEVNLEQALAPKQQKLLHRRSFKCDFFWPGRKVAVEYDSKGFHSDADRIERDAVRRNTLEYLGITVLTLTWNQLRDHAAFETFAVQLASHLGIRLRDSWTRHHYDRMRLHRRLILGKPSPELVSLGYGRAWK